MHQSLGLATALESVVLHYPDTCRWSSPAAPSRECGRTACCCRRCTAQPACAFGTRSDACCKTPDNRCSREAGACTQNEKQHWSMPRYPDLAADDIASWLDGLPSIDGYLGCDVCEAALSSRTGLSRWASDWEPPLGSHMQTPRRRCLRSRARSASTSSRSLPAVPAGELLVPRTWFAAL